MVEYSPEEYEIFQFDRRKYDEYDRLELIYFLQDAQDLVERIYSLTDAFLQVSKNGNGVIYSYKPIKNIRADNVIHNVKTVVEHASRAKKVLDDWSTLQRHLDENPTLREEWDNFMMAIKLTEDLENE